MSELPSGWAETTIGEVLQFNYGKGLPERDRSGSGFSVYGSNGVVGYHEKAFVSAESLVVGRKGSVGEVHHSRGPCWPIDTTYFVDEFSGMPARFWYYALKGLDLGGLNRATAIPGLNREDAYQVDIALPPQTEQKRIADKLDAVLARVDACRDRLDRVPTILKRFRQAVLAAATSGRLTEEWRQAQRLSMESWQQTVFEQVCKEITVGHVGKMAVQYRDSGIPFLRSLNVRPFRFDSRELKYISPEFHRSLAKSALRPGDVVVVRTGAPGQCCVIPQELPEANCSDLVIVRPGPYLSAAFAAVFINSETSQAFVKAEQVGVAQTHFNVGSMKRAPLQLPSLLEQNEIVHRVEALFAYAARLEARYTAARAQVERLTPALLAKAFHGELVPQDPNDEPASVLLERIRAARVASEDSPSPNRRKGSGRSKTSQKSEVLMLTRKDVQDTHLTTILKERGPLTAEALWSASQLDIDDFYDQLKDEEARGLLREKRGDSSNALRMVEAA
jgi:type I restriction enzyme, S subunit